MVLPIQGLLVFVVIRLCVCSIVSIREDVPVGTFVANMSSDHPSESNFRLYSDESLLGFQTRHFTIDVSGVIHTNASLDYEDVRLRRIRLFVIGSRGNLNYGHNVTVIIKDANDNSPYFMSPVYNGFISENEVSGSAVSGIPMLRAHDRDSLSNGVVRYEIINSSEWFEISKVMLQPNQLPSLSLKSKKPIDRESRQSFDLVVKAVDAGGLSGIATIHILIEDKNDNSPQFATSMKNSVSIPESASVGQSVFQARATDIDYGINGQIYYSLATPSPDFSCHPETGIVSVASPLDYDTPSMQSYSLTVRATDRGIPANSNDMTMTVNVMNSNEHAPAFSFSTMPVSIYDNAPIGFTVTRVELTDEDAAIDEVLELEITDGDPLGFFRVGPSQKVNNKLTFPILLEKGLNEDPSISRFFLTLVAHDAGHPQLWSQSRLAINVTKVENFLRFEKNLYRVDIKEDAPIGTLVLWAQAGTSPRISRQTQTTFRLFPNDKFRIERNTGAVTVRESLDRELQDLHSLTVVATREPSSPVNTNISIRVLDANDHTPKFSQLNYSVSLSENATVGQWFPAVTATDADIGNNGDIRYKIINSTNPGWFKVNEFNGAIAPSMSLDYEATGGQSVGIIIRAEDQGQPLQRSSDVQLLVSILNVNDNPPMFQHSKYSCVIPEEESTPTSCIQLSVHDLDGPSINRLTFSIVSGDPRRKFTVDSNGKVSTTGPLDRETVPSYLLTVAVNDGQNDGINRATVAVTVLDIIDQSPQFSNTHYTVTIEDNLAIDSVVATVHATTADIGRNALITYSLQGSLPMFKLDPFSGEIRLSGSSLNASAVPKYTGNVIATNTGTPPMSATATIIVNVVLRNPSPYFKSGPEDRRVVASDTSVGKTVATVQAIDINDRITYSLAKTSSEFSLVGNKVVTSAKLQSGTEYMISITATDSRTPQKQTNLNLYITAYVPGGSSTPSNIHRPQFQQTHYETDVSEESASGTVLVTVSATDDDSPSLTYSIIDVLPSSGQSLFNVTSGGDVVTTAGLDRESSTVYFLTVQASDSDMSTRCAVTVLVNDINDNGPVLPPSLSVDVQENVPVGSRILTLTNSDPDVGDNKKASYRFEEVTDFYIIDATRGYIYTKKLLDLEAVEKPPNKITVNAEEKESSQVTRATILFNYIDVNDNWPFFQPTDYAQAIPETFPLGDKILTVSANDADVNKTGSGRVTFQIMSGNEDGVFYIDDTTGVLSAVSSLDYEVKKAHTLQVEARDHGVIPQTATIATVSLTVTNVNDFTPVFQFDSYTFEVDVSASGAVVGSVSAIDQDLGPEGQLQYELKSLSGFSIDSTSGKITVPSVLTPGKMTGTVVATDQGSLIRKRKSADVAITINVIGPNRAPFLPLPVQHLTMYENEEIGYVVTGNPVKSLVTDPDEGYSGFVLFAITGGNGDVRFDVNSESGHIFLLNELDRESISSYDLTITANDLGHPTMTATIQYKIQVLDVNDNVPQFDINTKFQLSVPENATIGTSVGTMSARDEDNGDNGTVQYRIVNDVLGHFSISPKTGQIEVSRPLDREVQATYRLVIEAYDLGTPESLSSAISIIIDIVDIPDTAPICNPRFYDITIYEDYGVPSEIVQIRCIELDDVEVRYSLQTPNSLNWDVDSSTGIVKLKRNISVSEKYDVFSVAAVNALVPTLSTVVMVNVSLKREDRNLHWPVFTSFSPLSGVVYENASLGNSVLQVSAVDDDLGSEGDVEYFIKSGNGIGKFAVNKSSGWLTIVSRLDFEVTSEYMLTVEARDKGSIPKSSHLVLAIIIAGVNNRPPIFPSGSSSVSLRETRFSGVFVAVTAGYDPDLFTDLHYTISSENDFTIDTNNGMVTTGSKGADRERLAIHSLMVKATDTDQSSSTLLLFVKLLDIDESPPKFVNSTYSVTVYSAVPKDWPLLQVVAQDNDQNPAITYSTVSSQLKVDKATGLILITGTLVPSRKYTLNVTASSGSPSPLTVVALVIITTASPQTKDAVNAKPVISVTSVTVREDQKVGTDITSAAIGTDPDGDILMYHIKQLSSGSSILAIDSNRGIPYLRSLVDRELQDIYLFNVSVFDGQDFASGIVTMTVTDSNDNWPVFNGPFEVLVYENMYPSSVAIDAYDADMGNNSKLDYWIEEVVTPQSLGLFVILPGSNLLNTTKPLDREAVDRHIMIICAEDRGVPKRRNCTQLTVSVQDTNDNAPQFPSGHYQEFVAEDTVPGSMILTVYATDLDKGNNAVVQYQLKSPINVPFFINSTTGDLILSGLLDFEKQQLYTLTVVALDQGNPFMSSTIDIEIVVQDIDDSGPVWMQDPYSAFIMENGHAGLSVVSVLAQSTHPVTYDIVSDPSGALVMDASTGLVVTASSLDREIMPSFNATIRSCSLEGLCSNATIVVTVGDINDNRPHFFLSDHYDISEDVTVGSVAFTLSVKDPDEGSNAAVEFFFVGQRPPFFTIGRDTGVLKVEQTLDREKTDRIVFQVEAQDKGTPRLAATAEVFVSVVDDNDNYPMFPTTPYALTVPIPVPVGHTVLKVIAHDSDAGLYGKVSYEIHSGLTDQKLVINGSSGVISVAENYNLKSQYLLVVRATDGGGRYSDKDVTIDFVLQPGSVQFKRNSYIKTVLENLPSHEVLTVVAVDFLQTTTSHLVYSFATPTTDFTVGPTTGVITSTKLLDREDVELYQFVVQAEDVSDRSRLAHADVHISVGDVNDNSPLFSKDTYQVTVKDTTEPAKEITRFEATDADAGSNANIVYSISSTTTDQFAIDSQTGVLSTTKSLDRTGSQPIQHIMTIIASDQGTPQRNDSAIIYIYIVDVDAPRFNATSYAVSVKESASIGDVVTHIVADTFSDRKPKYTIVSGDDDHQFNMDLTKGIITISNQLDFEQVKQYRLVIRASDTLASTLFAQATLNVTVIDVNDNDPIFLCCTPFIIIVDEDIPSGTVLKQLKATDLDSGPFGDVHFSLVNSTQHFNKLFSIHPQSGNLTNTKSLDYEQYDEYRLIVIVQDYGQPPRSSETEVLVRPINVNDNPPIFQQDALRAKVDEDATMGTTITTIQATDEDGDPVTYELLDHSSKSEFKLNERTGVLTLTVSKLTRRHYNLGVQAYDGVFLTHANLTIEVLDVNDNRPVFNMSVYQGQVAENQKAGTFVAQVFATDDDFGTNGQVIYDFATPSNEFSIDPINGKITTAMTLDREITPSYRLTVKATDGGGISSVSVVFVTVLDVNDKAPKFSLCSRSDDCNFELTVSEATVVGDLITTLSADDEDFGTNSVITYSIINSTEAQFPFRIDNNTGDLILTRTLDFETLTTSYILPVVAVDQGQPPLSGQLHLKVSVTDAQDTAPQFQQQVYSAAVLEQAEIGTPVVTVCAGDFTRGGIVCPSVNRTVSYSIVRIVAGEIVSTVSYFRLDSVSTGLVTVRRQLPDLFIFSKYSIDIQAIYMGRKQSNFAVVQVDIIDINNNEPIWTNGGDYSAKVLENRPAGQTVVTVNAEDADKGINAEVRYYMLKPQSVPFMLNNITGDIYTTRKLDREVEPQFIFFVYAEDRGNQSQRSADRRVIVNVEDENDNSPKFNQKEYSADVSEAVFPNHPVVTVTASDADAVSRNKLRYTITGGNGFGAFSIKQSTGEITVATLLDRETTPNYVLNVSVFDSLHTTFTTVKISVGDVNDNPPIFESTNDVLVRENTPIGQSVLSVTAKDADVGRNAVIEYSLSTQTPYSVFNINASTGDMTLESKLDYENTTDYQLTIVAYNPDDPNMNGVISVRVKIKDVNDNPPHFSSGILQEFIEENLPPDSTVGQVTANDRDSGINRQIQYSLADDANGTFAIKDNKTAWITTTMSLDREQQDIYTIIILATDSGIPSLSNNVSVVISVTDVNDNSPKFPVPHYNSSLLENTSVGKTVVTVAASDQDEGRNARILYVLVSSDDYTNFEIESKTGEILLTQEVDYESTTSYTLTVHAIDGGFPIRSSSVSVFIEVLDVNDNAPNFIELPYSATVNEDVAIGFVVFQPSVSDRDSSSNAKLYFSITAGNSLSKFRINESTGEIQINQTLDREIKDSYELEIEVHDGGLQPLSSRVTILITVLDVNDNSPSFKPSEFHGEFPENLECTGQVLVQLDASDPDLGSGGTAFVTFSLDDGNEFGRFALRGDQIVCNATFDREEQKEYVLTVAASDKGNPPRTSYTTAWIVISDVDDNPPVEASRDFLVNYIDDFKGPIGRVGIYDPDDDDTMTYRVILGDIRTINVNSSTGALYFVRTPTQSEYVLNVTGTQLGIRYSGSARILVQQVTDAMINESVTLQLKGTTPSSFIGLQYSNFKRAIAEILKITEKDVRVLSVQAVPDHDEDIIDVVFVALHENQLYPREFVQSETFLKRSLIEGQSELNLLAVFIDKCVPEACQNHGTCHNVFLLGDTYDPVESPFLWLQSLHQFRDYKCSCIPSFEGKNCGQGFQNFCHSSPCLHGGTCVNGETSFSCNCFANVTGDICEFKKNYCESQPCKNNGKCVDQPSSYSCICTTDYTGYDCEQPLFAFDLCAHQWSTVCDKEEACTSGPYNVTCTCDIQMKGSHCAELDDQNVNITCKQNPCQFGGTCIQSGYGYECTCPLGFEGENCEVDIDECSPNPCLNSGKCVDGQGGYKCNCMDYTGRICETEVTVPQCGGEVPVCGDLYCDPSPSSFECVDLCDASVCKHGGTCHQRGEQTWCLCLDKWSGDHCELSRASFSPESFIMFPVVELRRNGELSLQFVTQATDALLLFNGRYDQIENDFLSVELVGGKLVVHYSVGGSVATVRILNSPSVNDGQWHSLDLKWQETSITVTLDECNHPIVTSSGTGDIMDKSNCFAESVTTGNFSSLDLSSPLFIGGLEDYKVKHFPIISDKYSGCVQNVIINASKFLDMRSPLKRQNVEEGCPVMENGCASNPCGNNANCSEVWDGYKCTCHLGYKGPLCEQERSPMMFSGDGYLGYEVLEGFKQRIVRETDISEKYTDRFEIRIRTREAVSRMTVWSIETSSQINLLEVYRGQPRFIFNLGAGGKAQIELAVDVADGQWHELLVERRGNTASLTVDQTHTAMQSTVELHYLFLLPEDAVYHIGGKPRAHEDSKAAVNGFIGCLQDPRLDEIEMPGLKEKSSNFHLSEVSGSVLSGCISSDVCSSNPCSLTETCVDDWEEYRCVSVNCSTSPCQHGGTCQSAGLCLCSVGYTGEACQTDIDECDSNPCLPGEDCTDLVGAYHCNPFSSLLVEDDDRLDIALIVVVLVLLAILVIMLVILRVWFSSRRSKIRMVRKNTSDMPNPYGTVEGPTTRYLRDPETRQELAAADCEGAGEEDVNRSDVEQNGYSGKRWSSSTQNSAFKPRPSADTVPRINIEPHYAPSPLVIANYAVTETSDEVLSPPRGGTKSRHPTGMIQTVMEEPTEEATMTSFHSTVSKSGGIPPNDVTREVEGFMTQKLEELVASENMGVDNDELCCFKEEGDLSETGSFSSLSGISDSGEESEAAFWNRVSTFGPQFKKLAELLAENSDLRDTST